MASVVSTLLGTRRFWSAVLSACSASACVAQTPAPGAPAAPPDFDGRWAVTLNCAAVMARGKMVEGISGSFFVDVEQGRLAGRSAATATSSGLRMLGRVATEGKAELFVTMGAAGSGPLPADPAQGHDYQLLGEFTASAGQAVRIEGRPCRATFARL